jgi:hypothetical protein
VTTAVITVRQGESEEETMAIVEEASMRKLCVLLLMIEAFTPKSICDNRILSGSQSIDRSVRSREVVL